MNHNHTYNIIEEYKELNEPKKSKMEKKKNELNGHI